MILDLGLHPKNYAVLGGTSYDADAQAFITAAGITDATQKSAVNQLVIDLKGYSIWTKMKAIYPIVGGTASTHKWNLKDPRDLDAAFRLTFATGWTHSSTGMLPNGTTAYADTFLNTTNNLGLNSGHLSFYSRTNNTTVAIDIGSYKSGASPSYSYIYTYYTSPTLRDYRYCENASITRYLSPIRTDGLFLVSRTSNVLNKGYRNGVIEASNTSSIASFTSTLNILIGAYNLDGSVLGYSNRQYSFASIGDGLTDTEATNFYTAVQNYQTTLGRQV